jgi:hypothetical protein
MMNIRLLAAEVTLAGGLGVPALLEACGSDRYP